MNGFIYEVTVIENTEKDLSIWSEIFDNEQECDEYVAQTTVHNRLCWSKNKPTGNPLLAFTVLICCYLADVEETDHLPTKMQIQEYAK